MGFSPVMMKQSTGAWPMAAKGIPQDSDGQSVKPGRIAHAVQWRRKGRQIEMHGKHSRSGSQALGHVRDLLGSHAGKLPCCNQLAAGLGQVGAEFGRWDLRRRDEQR